MLSHGELSDNLCRSGSKYQNQVLVTIRCPPSQMLTADTAASRGCGTRKAIVDTRHACSSQSLHVASFGLRARSPAKRRVVQSDARGFGCHLQTPDVTPTEDSSAVTSRRGLQALAPTRTEPVAGRALSGAQRSDSFHQFLATAVSALALIPPARQHPPMPTAAPVAATAAPAPAAAPAGRPTHQRRKQRRLYWQ